MITYQVVIAGAIPDKSLDLVGQLVVDGEGDVSIRVWYEVSDQRRCLLGRLMVWTCRGGAVVVSAAHFHHLNAGLNVVAMGIVHQVGQSYERMIESLPWSRTSFLNT